MLKIIFLIARVIAILVVVLCASKSAHDQDTPHTIYACTALLILALA